MITLYSFGPMFGLPDASPFVTKAEMLLKLSGLPFVRLVAYGKRLTLEFYTQPLENQRAA